MKFWTAHLKDLCGKAFLLWILCSSMIYIDVKIEELWWGRPATTLPRPPPPHPRPTAAQYTLSGKLELAEQINGNFRECQKSEPLVLSFSWVHGMWHEASTYYIQAFSYRCISSECCFCINVLITMIRINIMCKFWFLCPLEGYDMG